MVSRKRPATDQVHRITAAPEPLALDQARRARRDLIQMGIRVVCFALAVALWHHVYAWVSVVLLVGAVVLPYIAVLLANAGRERRDAPPPSVDLRAIGATGRTAPHDEGPR